QQPPHAGHHPHYPPRRSSDLTGGIAAVEPVATTTAFRAARTSSPTRTRRSPSSVPLPRNSSMPRSSSHGSWPESSRFEITSSRRSEEHTSELQSLRHLVCRLL